MKKSYIFILACLLAVAFTSCEKAFMKPDESNDPVNVFEYLWTRVDQLYTYFDIKGVDWDSVHAVYRPMVYDEMSDDSLFSVCAAMLNTLRDGHTNLFSDFDVMRSDTISYWMSEYNCYNQDVVLQHYLTLAYHQKLSLGVRAKVPWQEGCLPSLSIVQVRRCRGGVGRRRQVIGICLVAKGGGLDPRLRQHRAMRQKEGQNGPFLSQVTGLSQRGVKTSVLCDKPLISGDIATPQRAARRMLE